MITADGLIVAVIGNEVRLVEPGGGQPVAHITTPAKIEPWTLAISPDGRLILAGDIQGGYTFSAHRQPEQPMNPLPIKILIHNS